MGTTPNGFPYPEPTDPVAAGADAIKALAIAVNARTTSPASGFVTGGGPSFGGTYTNILTASATPPAAPGADGTLGAWTLHAIGNVQFYPRNAGAVQVAAQMLAGPGVGGLVRKFLPTGTGNPAHIDSIGLVYAACTWSSPPAGAQSIVLRAASTDGVAYPTPGDCWIAWFWTY